jgi:repressor LexA
MGTDMREQIYAFIVTYIQANGMPPTIREIGDALGIASTGHVDYHLKSLEKQGRISRLPGLARGIRLSQPPSAGIPIMGAIAAGLPIDVFPGAPETMLVEQTFRAANVFALMVRGISMIEDHICDGDYVVIKPQPACENGDIVVAVHMNQGGGSATLKRFFQEQNQVRLQPANSEMDPIIISRTEWDKEWQIQGKVVAIFRPALHQLFTRAG